MANSFVLAPSHLSPGARLYADRRDMVRHLSVQRGGAVCEIGVEFGDFSEYLINELSPAAFSAFDLFDLHLSGLEKHQARFLDLTHVEFYRQRFARYEIQFEAVVGDSAERLVEVLDATFDLVYVDGDHRLEGVRRDAEQAARIVKSNGIIVFNDYTLYDPFAKMPYGVVPVVNEMCLNEGWQVIGFALQSSMFCDIALARPTVKS